jgi:hypothetical protein
MGELDEDELRLLAEAEPNPIVTEPVPIADDGEIVEPPPIADEPPKVIEPLLEAAKRQARRGRPRRDEPEVVVADVGAGPALPDEGNSTVPPVQMDFGDPWGRLPAQMRHFTDGTPAL